MATDRDAFFMRKALALAERGRGRTSPNPIVGAIVVDPDGVIVGRGAHEVLGGPHAEINALRDAGARAAGATLYCTLEPCTHFGRTGPCAPQVADAGIGRVVVACDDPNPVAGGGNQYLRGRGLQVTSGVLAVEVASGNRPFFTLVQQRRPFITMKVALSADGMVAAGEGLRTALTGPAANRLVHRERAEVDAIAVGSGTMLADDPLLTARVAYRDRPLTRLVYDARLRTPPTARLLSTVEVGPVIIICDSQRIENAPERVAALRAAGAVVEALAPGGALHASMQALGTRGMSSVVIEGGPTLHRAFWDADLVDRVEVFVAPRTLGTTGVRWLGERVMNSPRVQWRESRQVGDDVLLEGYVHRTD